MQGARETFQLTGNSYILSMFQYFDNFNFRQNISADNDYFILFVNNSTRADEPIR